MVLYFVIQQQRIKMSDISYISSHSLKKSLVAISPYPLQASQKVIYNDNSLCLNPGDINNSLEQTLNN